MKDNTNNNDLKQLSKGCIVQSLLLLMQDTPYTQISITDICKRAGVSRNAFYRNYPAKDAILRRYLYEQTDNWRRVLRQQNELTAIQYFTSLFEQCGRFKELTRKMCNANLDYILIDLFFTFYGDLTKKTPISTYLKCHMAGSVYAIFIHWVMNNQPESPDEIARMLCRFNHIAPSSMIIIDTTTDIDTLMTSSTFTYRD